jgi:type 2 lantibiotic biosynthesis protein LanM
MALGATDLHFENLIAAGAEPVLVDLETIFHPRPTVDTESTSTSTVRNLLQESVLSTGLLPVRSAQGTDYSGLTGPVASPAARNEPMWLDAGTDRMRMVRALAPPVGAAPNLPGFRGHRPDPRHYVDEIEAGFRECYEILRRNAHELIADGGRLDAFASVETRFVARPTQTYAVLLFESFHPHVLSDSVDREGLLGRLSSLGRDDVSPGLLAAELAALWIGDIPRFTGRPKDRALANLSGKSTTSGHVESSLARAKGRIASFDTEDANRQVWLIRSALEGSDGSIQLSAAVPSTGSVRGYEASIVEAAFRVGDELCRMAIRGPSGVTWLWHHSYEGGRARIGPVGVSLYDGLAGIALFLGSLARMSGDQAVGDVAYLAVQEIRSSVSHGDVGTGKVGAFTGAMGIAYAFCHLSELLGAADLNEDARAIVSRNLPSLMSLPSTDCDVVSGIAGALHVLVTMQSIVPSDSLMSAAVACGDWLIRSSNSDGGWRVWYGPAKGAPRVLGYGHGAAGMCSALYRLWGVCRRESFADAAREGLRYLARQLRESSALPGGSGSVPFATGPRERGWCNGLSGAALGMLQSLELVDDCDVAVVDETLRAVCTEVPGRQPSLCHGDLGALESLRSSDSVLKTLKTDASRWAASTAGTIATGALHGGEGGLVWPRGNPGLLDGIAGLGYGLLRCYRPENVPNVLALE